jgi:hypothetical protein
MKVAETTGGEPIEASLMAPKQAVCPCCGGRVTLRSRRVMGDGKRTYHWRHQGNVNRDCSARHRPVG